MRPTMNRSPSEISPDHQSSAKALQVYPADAATRFPARWVHGQVSVFSILLTYGGICSVTAAAPGELPALAEKGRDPSWLAAGESHRSICRRLGRPASTVGREVAKNEDRAVHAEDRAWPRARRPKTCLLARRPALRRVLAEKLTQDWSP
jgi:hypothetical protein